MIYVCSTNDVLAKALKTLLSRLPGCPEIEVSNSLVSDKDRALVIVDGRSVDFDGKVEMQSPTLFLGDAQNSEKKNSHYLPLKFSASQFLNKVQALLNEKNKMAAIIDLGHFTFHQNELLLIDKKTKSEISLTEKERDILLYLYKHKEGAVSKQALLDHVWGYQSNVETHTLETHIYRLRQKIENNPEAPDFLMTEESGYKLNLD